MSRIKIFLNYFNQNFYILVIIIYTHLKFFSLHLIQFPFQLLHKIKFTSVFKIFVKIK